SWVVMTLFLVATGWEFWILMALLNGRDAPHGAVLQYFFGGTFLYWLFLMFIVAVIAMRLIAEERRAGTLEPLLTAPVSELDVVETELRGNAALQYVNLFRHMEDFGRGIVDSRRFVHHLSLVVLGLYASARMLAPSRRAAVEILLLLAILAGVNVLSARHYVRGDWTRGRTYALSDKTRNLLHA